MRFKDSFEGETQHNETQRDERQNSIQLQMREACQTGPHRGLDRGREQKAGDGGGGLSTASRVDLARF